MWWIEHRMSVRRFGKGPSIVWIHGLGEWSVTFEPLVAALPGFTHVLVDLPGYGRSPWPEVVMPNSLDGLADHLAGWLADQPPAILVGHSMGGVLATLVAERMPVRAVVDVEGNLSRGDCNFSAQALPFDRAGFVAKGLPEMRDRVYEAGRTDLALRGYHGALCVASPEQFHQNAIDLVALSEEEVLATRLSKLDCPVLYVAGVPDGICAYSRALLGLHGIRWVGLEPAGHWVFVDQPARFCAAVNEFAAEVDL